MTVISLDEHRESARYATAGVGPTGGWVRPGFEDVARVFRRQLRRSTGGAAVAVYHRGELVVDLWGGSRAEGQPWQRDTLAMSFSTTKGVISTALHLLADRGQIEYDAPVAAYWPQFAQHGKERITVRHVLTHSAGLHRMRTLVDHAQRMLDWEYMVAALERAEPAYEPGTRHGYHALTYGWLAGELVRRVSGRPVAQFVEEELARPLGLDGLHVGCPPEQRGRAARLTPMAGALGGRLGLQVGAVMGGPVGQIPSLLRLPISPRRLVDALLPRGIEDVLWGPEVMDAEIPAANGFFTARSLAKLYALLAHGGQADGVRLLSPQTLEKIAVVHSRGPDHVLVVPMGWRLGYHSAFSTRGTVPGAFGHFGFGGSGGWADPRRDLALAMVCNSGTGTPIADLRMAELSTAVARAPGAHPFGNDHHDTVRQAA
jgi:CubicO group peptidase (beta-lactamase class C family)